MTQEEKWSIAIQRRGYLVLAWTPGHKVGDVGPRIVGREGISEQPMVVIQETGYWDHVAQREILGEKPSPAPGGMVWYRFTTD